MKKNKAHRSLKLLREACGLTQPQFAKRLGISWRTVVAIEVGQREITRDMAERMMIEFGVLPESLLSRNGPPLDLNGEVYTPESFGLFNENIDPVSTELFKKHQEQMNYWLTQAGKEPLPFPKVVKMSGKRKLSEKDFYPHEIELIEKATLHLKWLLRAAARSGRLESAVYLFERWKQDAISSLGAKSQFLDVVNSESKNEFDKSPLVVIGKDFVFQVARTSYFGRGPVEPTGKQRAMVKDWNPAG